jgi:tetratricopeptide (TPR) repeat protein
MTPVALSKAVFERIFALQRALGASDEAVGRAIHTIIRWERLPSWACCEPGAEATLYRLAWLLHVREGVASPDGSPASAAVQRALVQGGCSLVDARDWLVGSARRQGAYVCAEAGTCPQAFERSANVCIMEITAVGDLRALVAVPLALLRGDADALESALAGCSTAVRRLLVGPEPSYDRAEAYVQRARGRWCVRRDDEALVDCERALALDPSCSDAHLLAARIALDYDRPEEAERRLTTALREQPEQAELYYWRAQARHLLDATAEAAADYAAALARGHRAAVPLLMRCA